MRNTVGSVLSRRELVELRRLEFVRHALEEMKKKGISQDIPICPNCKSFRVIQITSQVDLGLLGALQPAYYCLDCGWYGRTLIVMTNRPDSDAVHRDMIETFGNDSEMRESDS